MTNDLTIEEFVLQSGFTPPTDSTVPDPHIVELIQVWDSMRLRREAKLYDALHDLHSLYAGTDRTLDEAEVLGEVQGLLYGDHQSEYSGVEVKK